MNQRAVDLKELLKEVAISEIKGNESTLISGITANSKDVKPGNLFIAKRGRAFDGNLYIPEAVKAGAKAILTDLYQPNLNDITQIIHHNPSQIEAQLAANYYQHPSHELLMVGITGTNGKTTTSFIIQHLLNQFKGPCGLIGTIEYVLGKQRIPATRTTPDVIANHGMLREMVKEGCRSAVMEVTSHALDQNRVDHIVFDAAIFSNLTQDHLDYHPTMEAYCDAKNRLFRELGKEKWAIVNQDSEWTPAIMQGCEANRLTYGLNADADLYFSQLKWEKQGTRGRLHFKGQATECYWPLVGRFNAYNVLAAMAVLLTQGFPLHQVTNAIAQIPSVRGRLQPVDNALGLQIYIDFAHSDDALKNVLQTLKELQKKGRLIVVFGCGGDRDRTKRPKMAKACERDADFCWVTSDNPRSEEPSKICEEIVGGFSSEARYAVEIDRKIAIQKAIEMMHPEDMLLIAGKGHEAYQIFAHETIPFDDHAIAMMVCDQLKNCLKTI